MTTANCANIATNDISGRSAAGFRRDIPKENEDGKMSTYDKMGFLNELCGQLTSDYALLPPIGGFGAAFGGYEPADNDLADTLSIAEDGVHCMAEIKSSSIDGLRAKARVFRACVGEIDPRDVICLSGPWQALLASIAVDAATIF